MRWWLHRGVVSQDPMPSPYGEWGPDCQVGQELQLEEIFPVCMERLLRWADAEGGLVLHQCTQNAARRYGARLWGQGNPFCEEENLVYRARFERCLQGPGPACELSREELDLFQQRRERTFADFIAAVSKDGASPLGDQMLFELSLCSAVEQRSAGRALSAEELLERCGDQDEREL